LQSEKEILMVEKRKRPEQPYKHEHSKLLLSCDEKWRWISTTGLNQASLLNHATKSIFRVKEHASMGFISMSLANSVCELRCELHS
jgi:hypothetical protein